MLPPSPHDAILDLLKQCPELLLLGYEMSSGHALPDYDELTIASETTLPTRQSALRADVVVVLKRQGKVVLVLVVEVQLRVDPKKPASLVSYGLSAHRAFEAPVVVVILTSSRAVERWASRPLSVGLVGLSYSPVVVGPSKLPRIDSEEAAAASPLVAILSAIAHARAKDAAAMLPATFAALEALPSPLGELRAEIVDILLRTLEPVARQQLEVAMQKSYEIRNPVFRKFLLDSRAEGEARGRAEDVLAVLDARGIAVPEGVAERVRACVDLDELGKLVRRAVVVASAEELFPAS